jgi:hypothetical protein
MQRDLMPPSEVNPLSERLRFAAEQIDPAAYREVGLALVAVDAPIGAVARLAYAIALSRGQDYQRDFIGEYAQLLWESLQDQLPGHDRSSP